MLPFKSKLEDVVEFKTSLVPQCGSQRKIDDLMLDLYRQKHIVDVTDPDYDAQAGANQDIQAIGMGKGPQIVDQWSALLGGTLKSRVNALGNSPTAEAHATRLEEFDEAAFLRMEERMGSQWKKIRKDIALFGRGLAVVLPVPQIWGGKEFSRNKGEPDKDYVTRLDYQRKRRFPIAWDHWDARSTYLRFGEFSYDAIRVRKLLPGEIVRRFPGAEEFKRKFDARDIDYNSPIDIIDYINDEWFGTFTDTEVLRQEEHFMGLNPLVLFEGSTVPDNEDIRWMGVLYHARHLLPAYDELISNILTNVRRDTRATTVVEHDPNLEGQGAEVVGRPKRQEVTPGGQLDIWKGEKVWRLGSAASNVDYGVLIPELGGALGDFLREIFMGQVRSDTTGTAVRLIAELANILQNDAVEGIRKGGRDVFVRVHHAIPALEKSVAHLRKKSKPGRVTVRVGDKEHGSREISITAKDVEGYDELVQVRYGLRTPSDERSLGDYLRLMSEDRPGTGPIFDMRMVRERAGIENPLDVEERVWRQRVVNSPEFITKVNQIAAQEFGAGQEEGKQAISPETMAFLQQTIPPEEFELLFGGDGAAPTPQGASSNVPAVNAMRAGEQLAVQEPRV